MTDALRRYIHQVALRETPILKRLRDETGHHPLARFQISPEQGQFMAQLVALLRAERIIEVGVFTGYSSLVMAMALPENGRIVACDTSEEYTTVAKRYWREADVAHKIDLRIGPAASTLSSLIRDKETNTYDFAFIDADKESYDTYYESLLQLVRPGGVIAVDNVLWGGRVADPDNQEPDTLAIRRFNKHLKDDPRIILSLLPIGDGLTLAMKR